MIQMAVSSLSKYSPQTDLVAGRSAHQIEAAKRKAVGGRKKRCVKGKSCSATCIAINKICLVDIPWVAAKGISKVRKSLVENQIKTKVVNQKAPPKFPAALKVLPGDGEDIKSLKENYNTVRSIALSGTKDGSIKDPNDRLTMVLRAKYKFIKGETTPFMQKLLKEREAEGPQFADVNKKLLAAERLLREKVILAEMIKSKLKKMPNSTPEEKAARDTMQKFLEGTQELNKVTFKEIKERLADKKKIKDSLKPGGTDKTSKSITRLPKISTDEEFKQALLSFDLARNPEAKSYHDRLTGIWNALNDTGGRYKDELDKVISAVGGIENFNSGKRALRDFTDEQFYARFRAIQRKAAAGGTLSSQEKVTLQRVEDAERLLAVLPKEGVVKFRGIAASDEKLKAILEASKEKGIHAEGALASWSTSLRTSKAFADKAEQYDVPNRVIFRTVNKHGASVKAISHFEGEDEIVTGGSVKYRHTGKYAVVQDPIVGEEYYIFDIEEL